MNWKHKVKVRHLFTTDEDLESVQESMNNIADVIEKESFFENFKSDIKKFRKIPKGDDYFGPVDYANKLLENMYNYADENSIWID